METNEIKKMENLRKIIGKHFNNPKSDNKSEFSKAQNKINYYERGCLIVNMLKMCVLTIDNEQHVISDKNKNAVNVSLILEMILEMFPLNEFELLGEISEIIMEEELQIV